MLHTITGEHGDYPPALEQVRFGQADPYCVRWETGEEPEPEFGDFASPVVARLAPRLASWVWLKRAERVLLRILKKIGAAPKLTEESRSEPSLDFAWGPVPGHGLMARQWAENWLGQAVAVLNFRTPRHAAEGGQADRLRLEGLLRHLEYQSALPAERGGRPVDTAWLRAELDLKSMKRDGSS